MSLIRQLKERQAAGLPTDPAAMAAVLQARDEAYGVSVSAEAPQDEEARREVPADPESSLSPGALHRRRFEMAAAAVTLAGRTETDPSADPFAGHEHDNTPEALFAARMRHQLDEHRRQLKAIQSVQTKIELKRQILPLYADWITSVFAAPADTPRGLQDEITVAIMIWLLDVGAFEDALPVAEYVLRHNLPMPGHFKSSVPVFLVDTVADAAAKAYRAGGDAAFAFPAGVLVAIEDLVADEDMHDQCRAKLEKAIGTAVLYGATDDDLAERQQQTLKRYLRALELDEGAGVKKDIEQLSRALKKAAADTAPPVETPPAETSPPQTPPADTDPVVDPVVGPTDPAAVEAILEPNTPTSTDAG